MLRGLYDKVVELSKGRHALPALAAVIVFVLKGSPPVDPSVAPLAMLWNPSLFGIVAIGTAAMIGGGSLYKTASLSGGGRSVAELLGGRLVAPDTSNYLERRLINVVEEMAIASGTPVPPVYVLDEEAGINAFAAGHQPSDAVVAVTALVALRTVREQSAAQSDVLDGELVEPKALTSGSK